MSDSSLTLETFFSGHEDARQLFESVRRLIETIGPAEIRVSKSQIAFRRRTVFALVWMPGQYLRGKIAPLALTIQLRRRDVSPRWKEVVEPSPGRYTHHLELYSIDDSDGEVGAWLQEAYTAAG